ncbi:MAG TPA: type VII secretion integral membrane protein EccD [Mycobacteriales bacterium]|nr:type VII secretion integral membrane protein EccD [Mycobacteriales bacterium]
MSSSVGAGLCRVTIIAPRSRVDVALPVDVPLAELLPTLLRHAGQDLPDAGLVHGGWALQRLGETPFDVGKNATALAIRDGEMLYLRPRQAQLPELAFDDVVDAIATASRDRSSRWHDGTTRQVSLTIAVVALMLGALVILRSGPSWLAASLVSGAVALGLLVAGAVLSRALGQARAGVVLGYAALPYAFCAGLTALGGNRTLTEFGPAQLVVGSVAVMVAAVLAAFAIADSVPGLVGAALAALVATLAALLDLVTGLTGPGTAALTVSFVLAVTPMIPMLAFRMADLPLPFIPLSSDDLRRDTSDVPGPTVLRKTLTADRFVTGMTGGTGALVMGCELLLSREPSGTEPWLIAVVATAALLRARLFFGRVQRLWLLSAGVLGYALIALTVSEHHSQPVRLVGVVVPLLIIAGSVVAVGLRLPGQRISPFWGRTADIVEALLVVSVVPLALAVLGLYGYVRGLSG